MTSAISELMRLPIVGKPRLPYYGVLEMGKATSALDDGLSEKVHEAQACINSNFRGVEMFVNKERFGSEPKKKVRKKWRASSKRSVQGGGTV